jgi:hypothetical protein
MDPMARFARMKTALAIVCSLLLAGMFFFSAQAQSACAERVTDKSCCCGDNSSCCAAKNSSESQPVSAAPIPSSFQNQFQILAPSVVAFTLANEPARPLSSTLLLSTVTHCVPLFERDCARLI